MAFKPDGYTSVAPYLIVTDVRAHLSFLKMVFDAEPLRFIERADGSVEHGEARIDDTVVMFGEMPGSAAEAHVHVYVSDPDVAFERALNAGASQVMALEDRDDGDRRGGFKGPPGVVWWVARQISD